MMSEKISRMTQKRWDEIRKWTLDSGIILAAPDEIQLVRKRTNDQSWIWQAIKDATIEIGRSWTEVHDLKVENEHLRELAYPDTIHLIDEQTHCPWCGSSIQPRWKYCLDCGNSLGQLGDSLINSNFKGIDETNIPEESNIHKTRATMDLGVGREREE